MRSLMPPVRVAGKGTSSHRVRRKDTLRHINSRFGSLTRGDPSSYPPKASAAGGFQFF